jgi:hypothetical protein
MSCWGDVCNAFLDFAHSFSPVSCSFLHLYVGQLPVNLLDYDFRVLLLTSSVTTKRHEKTAVDSRFVHAFPFSPVQKCGGSLVPLKHCHWGLVREDVLWFKFGKSCLLFLDDGLLLWWRWLQ